MEFVEEKVLPCLTDEGLAMLKTGQVPGHDPQLFHAYQCVFCHAVFALADRVGGIAAAGVVLQFFFPYRQRCIAGTNGVKETVGRGIGGFIAVWGLGKITVDLRQIANGGAAAVIADAVKAHGRKAGISGMRPKPVDFLIQIVIAVVFAFNAAGQYTAAVRAFPLHGLIGDGGIFPGSRAHPYIVPDAGFFQQLGCHGIVTEAVHIVAGLDGAAEFFHKVALAV